MRFSSGSNCGACPPILEGEIELSQMPVDEANI